MDEAIVREHAETHARGVVEGDLRLAGGYLTPEAREQAGGVMKALPDPIKSAEVTSVEASGAEYIAQIRYLGESGEATVESRWADRDGRPMILGLTVM